MCDFHKTVLCLLPLKCALIHQVYAICPAFVVLTSWLCCYIKHKHALAYHNQPCVTQRHKDSVICATQQEYALP